LPSWEFLFLKILEVDKSSKPNNLNKWENPFSSAKPCSRVLRKAVGFRKRQLGYTWVRFRSPRVATKCNILLQHKKSDQHLCTQFLNYLCIFIYFTMVTNNVEEDC
jgi:hypothetical protein